MFTANANLNHDDIIGTIEVPTIANTENMTDTGYTNSEASGHPVCPISNGGGAGGC